MAMVLISGVGHPAARLADDRRSLEALEVVPELRRE
jgi:hypothetical protein